MSTQEWYDDLLSNMEGSEFDKNKIPDIFKLTIHDGDNVYAEWDLSKELRENGTAFKKYTNASQNIDAEFFFLHEDLAEEFKDDESLMKLWDKISNDSSREGVNFNTSTVLSRGDAKFNLYTTVGFGGLSMLLGLVGLIIKARADSQTRVVKVTKLCGSIMCIVISILVVLEEAMKHKSLFNLTESNFFSVKMVPIVSGTAANVLLKAFLMSWKGFTMIIYVFQNIMLYWPFFFREHKKALGKWFLRASLTQSVAILVGFSAWAIVLILSIGEICEEIVDHTEHWHIALVSVGCLCYSGSLLLCSIFVIGYYRKNVKGLRRSEVKSIWKTMIACLIEILFDITIVVIYLTGVVSCLSFKPYYFLNLGLAYQSSSLSKCDIKFKWWALDSGLSECTVLILLCQAPLQEAFFVFSELAAFCSKNKCW